MFKHILALTGIFSCTSFAWFILGGTIESRTYASNDKLRPGVASTWGTPQEQRPPVAAYLTDSHTNSSLPLEGSRINVRLALDYRQKGLLWYSTYVVDFAGQYRFHNDTAESRHVTFQFKFPAEKAVYDGLLVEVNGQPAALHSDQSGVSAMANLAPGETGVLHVAYRSYGMERWRYKLADSVAESRDFQLDMKTNFKEIDFPPDTLSPTEKRENGSGWDLTWKYTNLISGFQIGMAMPEKLQPGPLAGEISYFAPVSLLLFFFLMFIISTRRNIPLHAVHYFFLATSFFAFHLLLAYLVDHVSIHLAFVICSAVSLFLLVSYLRLVTGMRFAAIEAGGAQFIYLVLFSCAFFLHGFTGLAVTIGCIVTLFIVMQLTGRTDWASKFR